MGVFLLPHAVDYFTSYQNTRNIMQLHNVVLHTQRSKQITSNNPCKIDL